MGEKNSAGGRRLCFKGDRRGGGPEGSALHGGGAGEREGERGGLGVVWSSVVAWHRRDSGPATTRAGGVLPRNSVGRRGRRDAGRRD
jgi:hypothetical protein